MEAGFGAMHYVGAPFWGQKSPVRPDLGPLIEVNAFAEKGLLW